MSENTQQNNTMMIMLVVIAALLAVIVGVLIYQNTQKADVPPVSQLPAATTDPAGTTGTSTGNSPGTTAPPANFDPKVATKVPAGTQPDAFVKAYYDATMKGDWTAAFDRLPADKKAGNSPDALKEQVSGYGITGFTMGKTAIVGDKATVIVDQQTTQYGTFENTWVFVKDGDAWLVESKAVTGMK